MDSFLLQDWLSLSMSGAGGTIVQSESGWLDLAPYRDAVAWLQVSNVSAPAQPILSYQTSPSKDDTTNATLFSNMAQLTTPAVGVTVTPMLQDFGSGGANNAAPLSRWLRWQLALAGNAWSINFRIWIAANKPGRAHAGRNAAARQ